jgi:hypothetical protein
MAQGATLRARQAGIVVGGPVLESLRLRAGCACGVTCGHRFSEKNLPAGAQAGHRARPVADHALERAGRAERAAGATGRLREERSRSCGRVVVVGLCPWCGRMRGRWLVAGVADTRVGAGRCGEEGCHAVRAHRRARRADTAFLRAKGANRAGKAEQQRHAAYRAGDPSRRAQWRVDKLERADRLHVQRGHGDGGEVGRGC